MNRNALWLVVLLMASTGASLGAAEQADDELVLAPESTVIVDRSVYAGKWLQYYLICCVAKSPEAMTYAPQATPAPDRSAAAAFPVVKDRTKAPADKAVIVVGHVKQMADVLSPEDMHRLNEKTGSVLIRRKGNMVVIAGSGGPWDFAPVRIFLDRCAGVRLYAPTESQPGPDELWLSMPRENRVTIGKLDFFHKPYFAKTAFSGAAIKRNQEWSRMNSMVSEGSGMRATHSIINYFPPEKYYGKHPELYPMGAGGSRPRPSGNAWNPCLAKTDLAAAVTMEEIRLRMKKNPPDYLSVSTMDCAFACQCPACRESMDRHGGSYSNLYYAYLNTVAKACQQEFPKLYLTAYLYSNVRTPPVGMRIEPNIVVDVVTKSYHWVNPALLEREKARIRAVSDLGASWITHDWDFSGVTPRIYNRQWAAFLQWAAQNGMKGVYVEWTGDESWYLDGARYWVLQQLLSDPYQDVDALWRQYSSDMFGAGAEDMYRFYETFAEKHVWSDQYCQRADLPRQEMACFLPEDLALQRRYLESAMAKTKGDALVQKRLAKVMRYFVAHELFARAVGEPARLCHTYTVLGKNTGINKDAIAFYVNDDAKTLLAAVDYYDTRRTVPPDANRTETALGGPLSYRSNYARALGTVLQAVRTEAMAGIDLKAITAAGVGNIVAKARQIFRHNLPPKHDAGRAQAIESMIGKILWIPRGQAMPRIDGDLSDAAWSAAAELVDWTLADLMIPSVQGNETRGKIMRVGDQLVLGLECKQPKGIFARTEPQVETGTMIWRETCCEVSFGPQPNEGEKPEYFHYVVNSLGAFRGFHAARDNRAGVTCAARTANDKQGYTLEVALPLKTDKYDYTQGRVFALNIMRQVYYADTFSPPERLGWHPLFFTVHEPASRALVFSE